MDGWLHFSVFILVFLSMFLHVCVCYYACLSVCHVQLFMYLS